MEFSKANPAKVEDFRDQHIDLARFLVGEVLPLRREARRQPLLASPDPHPYYARRAGAGQAPGRSLNGRCVDAR
jgi:hypothetical protein